MLSLAEQHRRLLLRFLNQPRCFAIGLESRNVCPVSEARLSLLAILHIPPVSQ